MSWIKAASESLWGALGLAPAPKQDRLVQRCDEIRESMMVILGESGAKIYPNVRRHIQFAEDPEALWYARSEWMSAISNLHGEKVADGHLRKINHLFAGLGHQGMMATKTSKFKSLHSLGR